MSLRGYHYPDRHYHSWRHIEDSLELLEAYRHLAVDAASLQAAIIWHDCIYDARRTDNEVRSAQVAWHSVQRMAVRPRVVVDLILSTAIGAALDTPDKRLLHDIDYAVFGAPWPRYRRYVQQVRQEYAHLADADFAAGRSAFIRRLRQRGSPFVTTAFRSRFGDQAARNLAAELSGWSDET